MWYARLISVAEIDTSGSGRGDGRTCADSQVQPEQPFDVVARTWRPDSAISDRHIPMCMCGGYYYTKEGLPFRGGAGVDALGKEAAG